MDKTEGVACVVCMVDQASGFDRLVKIAREAISDKYADCLIVKWEIANGDLDSLSPLDRQLCQSVLSGIQDRQYAVLILYGYKLTAFGEKAQLLAKRSGLKTHVVGVGNGTLARRYEAWFKRKRHLTDDEVAAAVEAAESQGINIC